jgi:hypothetical protein
VKGNDLPCDKDGKCHEFRLRSAEQAMILCQSYGKECQGFVFASKSGRLFLKTNVSSEPLHDPFLEFYVRAEFRKNVDLVEERQCAIPIEDFQESSQFKCTLPVLDPFNANIMKYMDKMKTVIACQGEHYTTYHGGILSLVRTGVLLIYSFTVLSNVKLVLTICSCHTTRLKTITLLQYIVDENRIEQCFPHCSQLSTILNNIITPDSGSTILFHIVDKCEQRRQQNIVQSS